MNHRITLERRTLRFAAAHFATYRGDCETLHGHNYELIVEIEGPLQNDAWVMDFNVVKQAIAAICKELDHKFILQRNSKALRISESETEFEIAFLRRRYVMPKADVAALPIDNSTAERLAEWFAARIAEALGAVNAGLRALTVGVEEAPGQAGWYTLKIESGQ